MNDTDGKTPLSRSRWRLEQRPALVVDDETQRCFERGRDSRELRALLSRRLVGVGPSVATASARRRLGEGGGPR